MAMTLVACVSAPTLRTPPEGPISASAGGAAGYQHGVRGSRLDLGGRARRVVERGYVREVGREATLAVNLKNGSAFGVPNANARSQHSGPYGASPEAHEASVRDYFVYLGLPAEQILRVRTLTQLEAHGRGDETRTVPLVLAAYYSVIDRGVQGIPVPDSFAWARVDTEGKVIAEGIYWPALSPAVVAGALKLRDAVADPQRQAALEAKIPLRIRDHGVAIRHSSAYVETPFEAFPSYDVAVLSQALPERGQLAVAAQTEAPSRPNGTMEIRHFDENGVELRLPQEQRSLGAATPRRPPTGRD
jgi:hypothetical protein